MEEEEEEEGIDLQYLPNNCRPPRGVTLYSLRRQLLVGISMMCKTAYSTRFYEAEESALGFVRVY